MSSCGGGAHVSQPPAHRDEAFLDVHRDPNCKSPSELRCSPDASWGGSESDLTNCKPSLDSAPVTGSLLASAQCNPASLTSFDSGFDGAGSSHLEGMEGVSRSGGGRDSVRPALSQTQINEENLVGLWGSEDHTDPSSPSPRVQVVSKVTADSLNLEIKVKRSAAPPNNPWLSLPVDDLENSYTVTITQNPQPQLVDPTVHGTSRCRDQPTQTEVLKDPQTTDCTLSSQSTLEDSELSPIHEVLSSTIRDKSTCTTETTTMIWDSYDLHEQYVDGVSDVSLKDWDVKEQEGLKEVENILDRADQILAEEENVLAQEAMLDVLLKEDRPGHWPPWNAEVQLCEMSSSELTEAGVLGLEDCPVSAEPQTFSEHRSEVDGHRHEEGGCNGRPDLLTELRKVHVLDELIAEENLKIHELRRCSEQETSGSGPSDPNQASSLSEDRHVFRLQLEKEREEVEKLERSLDKEQEEEVEKLERSLDKEQEEEVEKLERSLDKEQEEKENKDGAGREGTCSTAEQNEEDAALCGERFQAESSGDDVDQLESDTNKSLNLEDPDSAPKLPSLNETGLNSDSDEASAELGIHPLGLDSLGENSAVSSPESSRTLETQLKDGVFDPGGGSAQLRASPPLSSSATEDEAPHSIEVTSADVSSADPIPTQFTDKQPHPPDQDQDHLQVLHPNVKEHSNNNNNNKNLQLESKMTLDSPDISLDDTKGQWTDEGSAGPDAGPHQCPPDCPLEFDPGGGGGVWISEATRTSGSGIQTQFNTNMTQMTSFQTPIVLDTGSGLMKAGFADQDLPSVIFPTIIGLPKYEEIMNSSAEREVYIGHEAQHMRGVLALKHPIRNGIIRNWDDMEKIWHHTFQQLCVDPEDHPVLVTEAAMNPLENRQRTVEIMFECFGVPFTYVAMQAVLALYAAGRTTGVVFDSGDGVSHSVPVFDGYCLPHAVQRFPLAGADVTAQLKKLLQEQGVSMRTTAELEIVREMKEKCCYLALNYEQELSGGGPSGGVTHYTMPDGQVVSLGTERFRAPEILFKPQLIGRDHYGMHESIFKSILGSDMDLRRCFLGNIILSGGNTLLGGLPERLQAELRGLVTSDLWDGVRVSSPSDRDFSVWSGGAVLANGAGPGLAWISQDEYEEHGPQIVFRKCF
uniref:Si:ch211-241j12.3 n=1 Tax=Sphaeramia orbicularis TaxID=375764 RepID=A0A672Z986_9TELE